MTVTFYPDMSGGGGGGTTATGTVAAWNNTTAYTAGVDMVTYNNAIWVAVNNNTSSTPSLTNTNWKRVADIGTSNNQLSYTSVTSNTTLTQGTFAIKVDTTSGNVTLTLDAIANFTAPPSNTTLTEFFIMKQGYPYVLTIVTTSPNTFSDGETSKSYQGNGVNIPIYLDFNSNVWRV